MTFPLWPVLAAMLCALAGSLGQLLFKTGSSSVGTSLSSWLTNWKVLAGFFLYGISAVGFIVALKLGKLSLLYPVIATSYIWVTLLSVWFLGEKINIYHWFGIALILSGVAIIVRGGGSL